MKKVIECVPNFSEGRDLAVIRQITDVIESVQGVQLLDVDPGESTNLYYTEVAKRKELQALLERLKSSGRSAPLNRVPVGIENIPRIEHD